ncbi:MAG: hypothetical protein ACQERI_08415 [Candidatus Krumholzibacteriota bacterium]
MKRVMPPLNNLILFLLAASVISALASCSGGEDVTSQVISAYGGEKGVESVLSFTGRGYLKVLPVGEKVTNLHLDLFQDHMRYRETYVEVHKGEVTNKWIWISDGSTTSSWSSTPETVNRPALEYRYLEYRFPLILEWMSKYQGEAVANKGPGDHVLNYQLPEISVEVTVGRKSGYILKTVISDRKNDLIYSEDYSDYRLISDIPFPNRIIKSLNGAPYCEFFIPVILYDQAPPDSVFAISEKDTAGAVVEAVD